MSNKITISSYLFAAFDLDGTLLTLNGLLEDNIEHGLRNFISIGVKPIIVTGRPLDSFQSLNLKSDILSLFQDIIICQDGNVFYNTKSNEVEAYKYISSSYFLELYTQFSEDIDFIINLNGRCYAQSKNALLKYSMIYRTNRKLINIESFSNLELKNIIDIYIFPHKEFTFYIPENKSYEFKKLPFLNAVRVKPRVSKAEGLLRLLSKEYNINDLSKVVAFGDGRNDIPMLKECGLGITVCSSHPEAVKHSDITLKSSLGDFFLHLKE